MQSDSQDRHVTYKNGGKHNEWKEKYRKKCFNRLKTGREKVQEHFRSLSLSDPNITKELANEVSANIVQEVLTENADGGASPELMEELSAELHATVMEWTLSQEAWQTAMLQLENKSLVCPVCRQGYLCELEGAICCDCGVRLEDDLISLGRLGWKLDEATSKHYSRMCHGKLEFSVMEMEGMGANVLNAHCSVCGMCELII